MAQMTGCRKSSAGMTIRVLIACGIAASITGCGGGWGNRKKDKEPEKEVDTSLSALSKESEPVTPVESGQPTDFGTTQEQVVESAKMMDDYFATLEANSRPESGTTDNEPEIQEQPPETQDALGDAGITLVVDPPAVEEIDETQSNGDGGFSLAAAAAAAEQEQEPETTEKHPEIIEAVDPEERKAELVAELVEVLTSLAQTSDNPGSAATALAGLDLSPAVLDGLYDEGVLSQAERSTLKAAQDVLASISNSGTIASPDAVAQMLERVKNELDRQSGIRVAKAVLCTQVDGFGKYEPFSTNEFTAGRSHEVIVYVEVDRFGWRELAGNDGQPRYEVELSQRLELYHVADDMNTWNRAAEINRSVSRNRVRDYYLINKVTLPANLSIGRYHLKVVMRDLVEEKVGEAIVTIRIVAR